MFRRTGPLAPRSGRWRRRAKCRPLSFLSGSGPYRTSVRACESIWLPPSSPSALPRGSVVSREGGGRSSWWRDLTDVVEVAVGPAEGVAGLFEALGRRGWCFVEGAVVEVVLCVMSGCVAEAVEGVVVVVEKGLCVAPGCVAAAVVEEEPCVVYGCVAVGDERVVVGAVGAALGPPAVVVFAVGFELGWAVPGVCLLVGAVWFADVCGFGLSGAGHALAV